MKHLVAVSVLVSTALLLCCADAAAIDFHLPGYFCEHVFTPPLETLILDVSPTDEIVVCPIHGEALMLVHEDGTIEEYAAPSSHNHAGLAFDSTGQLYVCDWWRDLW